jgi:radical SAM protein with 4Fe4S-binding SPASM domain
MPRLIYPSCTQRIEMTLGGSIMTERFVPVGGGVKMSSKCLSSSELRECFHRIYALREIFNVSINDPLKVLVDKKIEALSSKRNYVCGGCLAGIATCVVSPNGDLKLCTKLPFTLGSLTTNEFDDLWHNNLTSKLRKRELAKCKRCKYLNVCGGCRAEAFSHYKDIFAEDTGCWLNVQKG